MTLDEVAERLNAAVPEAPDSWNGPRSRGFGPFCLSAAVELPCGPALELQRTIRRRLDRDPAQHFPDGFEVTDVRGQFEASAGCGRSQHSD